MGQGRQVPSGGQDWNLILTLVWHSWRKKQNWRNFLSLEQVHDPANYIEPLHVGYIVESCCIYIFVEISRKISVTSYKAIFVRISICVTRFALSSTWFFLLTKYQHRQRLVADLLLPYIFLVQIMEKKQFSWTTPNSQLQDHPLGPNKVSRCLLATPLRVVDHRKNTEALPVNLPLGHARGGLKSSEFPQIEWLSTDWVGTKQRLIRSRFRKTCCFLHFHSHLIQTGHQHALVFNGGESWFGNPVTWRQTFLFGL